MAISNSSLLDILWKKVLNDKSTTDVGRKFFEEPFLSRPIITHNEVWLQSDQIPAGGALTGVVSAITVTMSYLEGTDGCYYDPTRTVKDLIGPSFNGYSYEIYRDSGDRINLGEADWYIDPYSGILTFFTNAVDGTVTNPLNNDEVVSPTKPPVFKGCKYVGKKGIVPNLSGLTYSGGTMSIDWSPISGTFAFGGSGTANVNNSNVRVNSIILLTKQSSSPVRSTASLHINSITPGLKFEVYSSNTSDTDIVGYLIINP